MKNETRIALLQSRIALLSGRGSQNARIVNKLKRQLRALQKEDS